MNVVDAVLRALKATYNFFSGDAILLVALALALLALTVWLVRRRIA